MAFQCNFLKSLQGCWILFFFYEFKNLYNFELYFHFNTAKWSHLCNFKASWAHAGLIRKSLESRDLVSSCLSKLSRKARHLVFLEAQPCCLSDKQRKDVNFHLSPDLNFKNCLSWTSINSIPILFFLALSKVLSPKFQLCNGAPTNSSTCIRPWALTGWPAAYCPWKDWRPEIRQTPWKSPEGQQIPTEKAVTRRGWERQPGRAGSLVSHRQVESCFTTSPSLGGGE